MTTVRIATRTSDLALAQATLIAGELAQQLGVATELVPLMTTGDQLQGPLTRVGGKGLFVKEIEDPLRDAREDRGGYGDIVWPEGRTVEMSDVTQRVAEYFGLEVEDLRSRRASARVAKKVAAELCCRYSGRSQREVGAFLGYADNGSVRKQRDRLREMLGGDAGLRKAQGT